MNDRQKSLMRVQTAAFAAHEAALFLDTHPGDQQALDYFRKMTEQSKEAKEAYVKAYGPLTVDEAGMSGSWDWVEGPWPWEREE